MTQTQALNILKTGASVFLTGEPGSGKTFLINSYIAWLKKHGIEPAITASTGIAATHIGGMTIHSYSGIGIADSLSKYEVDRIASTERIAKRILSTSVLIIDEISMLDGARLGMVDAIFRAVKRSEMSFGGTQVILVGDFFQLPPISRGGVAVPFAFESQTWQELSPIVCYLTEQHRQEDVEFTKLLTAIRKNAVDQDHIDIIMTRQGDTPSGGEIPKLFAHNADVDKINAVQLAKLPGEPKVFAMTSIGSKSVIEQLKRGCLSPENLELKKNAVVMFTKNSRKGSYVNGTLGKVVGFNDSDYPIVKIHNGESIEVAPAEWMLEERGKKKASITQFPLRLAWAMTVHKSQGMSMDAAIMDLSSVFEFGQGYVALSRVRKLSGLHIRGINNRAFQVHPDILVKDQEFQNSSDSAEEKLAKMFGELQALHEQFVLACGGSPEEIEIVDSPIVNAGKKSENRWEETWTLIKNGNSIAQVAILRGRTPGTIVAHLEELKTLGKLEATSIAHLLQAKENAVEEIQKAFEIVEPGKLRTIFDHFEGRHSFDDIRLARLFYKL